MMEWEGGDLLSSRRMREEEEADALVWRSGVKNLGKRPPFMDDGKKDERFDDDMDTRAHCLSFPRSISGPGVYAGVLRRDQQLNPSSVHGMGTEYMVDIASVPLL